MLGHFPVSRDSLVSDIPAGDGKKMANLILQCRSRKTYMQKKCSVYIVHCTKMYNHINTQDRLQFACEVYLILYRRKKLLFPDKVSLKSFNLRLIIFIFKIFFEQTARILPNIEDIYCTRGTQARNTQVRHNIFLEIKK